MENWIDAENGEKIKRQSVIGVGPIKTVKVSSGKGDQLVERTVYNFTIRLGTGGVIIKSPDHTDAKSASDARDGILI